MSGVGRAAHLRSDGAWLARAWANVQSKVLVIDDGAVLAADDELVWTTPTGAPAGERVFLGAADNGVSGTGYFAVFATLLDPPPDGVRAATLRALGASLAATDAAMFAQAAALEKWHARFRFCPYCGGATVVAAAGHLRRCVTEGSDLYPRTDPAVIMLVIDDEDRALLGHQPSWPAGRMSTLAGFVEAGEALEQAVAREVFEEVGVVVDDVRYVGSQPWPFPSSLMLAFTAHAASSELVLDGVEITEARWFRRDEVADCVADGSLGLPMRSSVAYKLINGWYGGGLADLVR